MATQMKGKLKVKRPYADLIAEAILQGHAFIPDPVHARSLGKAAKKANGTFIVTRPERKTYPTSNSVVIPCGIELFEEFEKYMIFDIGEQNEFIRQDKKRNK